MNKDKSKHLNTGTPPPGWPPELGIAAKQGLIGEIVETLAPGTEADPSALVVQTVTILGSAFGPSSQFCVGATPHHCNLYSLSIGESARARKGTGTDLIVSAIDRADPLWSEQHIKSGLSTGEGVIAQASQGGGGDAYANKTLPFLEPEFSAVLQAMRRLGNTLSATLRQAWDGRTLQIATRNLPLRVTGAHISLLAHVTVQDLARYLDLVQVYGGLFNRFLFACSRRSKFLPDGGQISETDLDRLAKSIKSVLNFARKSRVVALSKKASELWQEEYVHLTLPAAEISPVVDAATARGEAQVRRLAMVFALADGSTTVKLQHLRAGLEVWRYCRDSAQFVFGGRMRSPIHNRILTALPLSGPGLSLTEISRALSNHRPANEIRASLEDLRERDLASSTTIKTAGRSAERWVQNKSGGQ